MLYLYIRRNINCATWMNLEWFQPRTFENQFQCGKILKESKQRSLDTQCFRYSISLFEPRLIKLPGSAINAAIQPHFIASTKPLTDAEVSRARCLSGRFKIDCQPEIITIDSASIDAGFQFLCGESCPSQNQSFLLTKVHTQVSGIAVINSRWARLLLRVRKSNSG